MATKNQKAAKNGKPEIEERETVDGILVRLTTAEDGSQQITIQSLGDTRTAEVPTLLRLAAQVAEKQLGLG